MLLENYLLCGEENSLSLVFRRVGRENNLFSGEEELKYC